MSEVNRLLTHQRAELDLAQRLQVFVILLQLATAVIAAGSVLYNDTASQINLAIGGFLTVVALFVISWKYTKHKCAGDQARRCVLIIGGLGEAVPPDHYRNLLLSFSTSIDNRPTLDLESYFRSDSPPGRKRLCEMIEESAFWTADLHKASFILWSVLLVVLIGLPLTCWWIAAQEATATLNITFARIVIAILVFVVSSHALGAALAHLSANHAICRVLGRIATASARGYPQTDLILIMGDYNAAVEAAPMILPLTYRLRKNRLTDAWEAYWQAK